MTVSRDGTAQALSTSRWCLIGQYHGIYRDIPIRYPGPNGSNYTLFLRRSPESSTTTATT